VHARVRERTPSAEVEQAILDAAGDLLESEGPQALTVRRIASMAGVAPMGVYNHFESKSGVLDHLFIQGFDHLRTALQETSAIEDPIDALIEGCRRYRVLALENPEVYRLMFLSGVSNFEPGTDAKAAALTAFGALLRCVQRAVDAGLMPGRDVTLAAQMIWSGLHGWVSLELDGMTFVEQRESAAEQWFASLIDGVSGTNTEPRER
jgi:AcrR family transcriptional regulator